MPVFNVPTIYNASISVAVAIFNVPPLVIIGITVVIVVNKIIGYFMLIFPKMQIFMVGIEARVYYSNHNGVVVFGEVSLAIVPRQFRVNISIYFALFSPRLSVTRRNATPVRRYR